MEQHQIEELNKLKSRRISIVPWIKMLNYTTISPNLS